MNEEVRSKIGEMVSERDSFSFEGRERHFLDLLNLQRRRWAGSDVYISYSLAHGLKKSDLDAPLSSLAPEELSVKTGAVDLSLFRVDPESLLLPGITRQDIALILRSSGTSGMGFVQLLVSAEGFRLQDMNFVNGNSAAVGDFDSLIQVVPAIDLHAEDLEAILSGKKPREPVGPIRATALYPSWMRAAARRDGKEIINLGTIDQNMVQFDPDDTLSLVKEKLGEGKQVCLFMFGATLYQFSNYLERKGTSLDPEARLKVITAGGLKGVAEGLNTFDELVRYVSVRFGLGREYFFQLFGAAEMGFFLKSSEGGRDPLLPMNTGITMAVGTEEWENDISILPMTDGRAGFAWHIDPTKLDTIGSYVNRGDLFTTPGLMYGGSSYGLSSVFRGRLDTVGGCGTGEGGR